MDLCPDGLVRVRMPLSVTNTSTLFKSLRPFAVSEPLTVCRVKLRWHRADDGTIAATPDLGSKVAVCTVYRSIEKSVEACSANVTKDTATTTEQSKQRAVKRRTNSTSKASGTTSGPSAMDILKRIGKQLVEPKQREDMIDGDEDGSACIDEDQTLEQQLDDVLGDAGITDEWPADAEAESQSDAQRRW